MYVVAIRHGKPLTEGYAQDDLKPLSDEGKKTIEKTALHLQEKKIVPDIIFSSPLLRAKQTADIVKDVLGGNLQIEDALGFFFDLQKLISSLTSLQNKTVFLVGHAPNLALFVNALIGEEKLSEMSKGSCAIVEFKDPFELGMGELLEYYEP